MTYPAFAEQGSGSTRAPFRGAVRHLTTLGLTLVAAVSCPAAAIVGWRIDPDFRPLITTGTEGPEVYAIAPTPDGKIIIAGGFSEVDDTPRPGLARLNADGTLDETFQPDVPAWAHLAVAVQPDGKVLAGRVSPTSEPLSGAVVRLNTDGSQDGSFDSELTGRYVPRAIRVTNDGRIIVRREVWEMSSHLGTPLARLLADGSIDPSFPSLENSIPETVVNLDLLPNDQMLAVGYFGESGPGAALLDPSGVLVTGFFTPGIPAAATIREDGSVTLLNFQGSGNLRPGLVRFDATGTELFARDIGAGLGSYHTILADGDGTIAANRQANLRTLERFSDTFQADPSLCIELGDDSGQVNSGSGSVRAMAYDATGALLAAGDFTNADGMAYTGVFRLIPDTLSARLANLSTRGYVGPGNDVLIAGFVVSGTEPQRVLVRAIAENLAIFDIPGAAVDVRMSVFRAGENEPIHQAESFVRRSEVEHYRVEWVAERMGAFPLQFTEVPGSDASTTDAATVLTLDPGGYTVVVEATTPGIGLVEIYDANGIEADRKLVNISGRARVGTGDEQVIAGFVVDRGSQRVLLRAVGPGIASMVSGTLADPRITLVRQSDGTIVDTNDNWGDTDNAAAIDAASRQVSGLHLASGSADAALLVELPVGAYTMIVSGAGETTGIALAEVYEVP